jgi:hypothetical protein
MLLLCVLSLLDVTNDILESESDRHGDDGTDIVDIDEISVKESFESIRCNCDEIC